MADKECHGCELCGRTRPANLMCTEIMEGELWDEGCWCVCDECRDKFIYRIDRVYEDLHDDSRNEELPE